MSLYLDASVLVPLIVNEPGSGVTSRFLESSAGRLAVSEFAAGETASALSRLVRTGALAQRDAVMALSDFDAWRAQNADVVDVVGADIRLAAIFVRRFDLMLRMPDAVHLAICRRLGQALATWDKRLAHAASALGVTAVVPVG